MLNYPFMNLKVLDLYKWNFSDLSPSLFFCELPFFGRGREKLFSGILALLWPLLQKIFGTKIVLAPKKQKGQTKPKTNKAVRQTFFPELETLTLMSFADKKTASKLSFLPSPSIGTYKQKREKNFKPSKTRKNLSKLL